MMLDVLWIMAWSIELIPQQPVVWGWRWPNVCSSGVLFAQQLAIAAMTGHRGRHANCHTQGKMSSTQFQPSCSLSSSSSSLQGHKNSSPWISRLHLLFQPRKGGDPISKTTSSWKHYHQISCCGRQPSHLPLIQIHCRSRENRLKTCKWSKKSYPAYICPSCSELIMCLSHSQRHLSSWNKADLRCPLMHYFNQTTRQLHS